MTRPAILFALLGLLAACAGPDAPGRGAADVAEPAPVIQAEPVVEAAPAAPDSCTDTGDGIGGTGCPID